MSEMLFTAQTQKLNDWFVVGMGIGTVFVGLICIIVVCSVIGLICRLADKKQPAVAEPKPAVKIENRGEVIAAVSAALAEELGTDVSAIRILSFKKI